MPTARNSAVARSQAFLALTPRARNPNSTFRRTLMCGNSSDFCCSSTMRGLGGVKLTAPAEGVRVPDMSDNSVDLPDPFGPMTAVSTPPGRFTFRCTPRSCTCASTCILGQDEGEAETGSSPSVVASASTGCFLELRLCSSCISASVRPPGRWAARALAPNKIASANASRTTERARASSVEDCRCK